MHEELPIWWPQCRGVSRGTLMPHLCELNHSSHARTHTVLSMSRVLWKESSNTNLQLLLGQKKLSWRKCFVHWQVLSISLYYSLALGGETLPVWQQRVHTLWEATGFDLCAPTQSITDRNPPAVLLLACPIVSLTYLQYVDDKLLSTWYWPSVMFCSGSSWCSVNIHCHSTASVTGWKLECNLLSVRLRADAELHSGA